MYPILNNCLVRGCEGDYYLQQYLGGEEYELSNIHAQILWNCNGQNSIRDLSKLFIRIDDDIEAFLNVLARERLVIFSDKKKNVIFPKLGVSPELREIQIEVTGQCNLWCKHCYGRKNFFESEKDELSFRELSSGIDQIADANIGRCFLTGGEAFTRNDLPDIIEYISRRHIHISGIFTNATIYRQEVLDVLKSVGHNTAFLISLDGGSPEIHDFIRGEGAFALTIDFIKKSIKQGFRVTVNTVVNRQNVKTFAEMRQFLENLGVSRWRISVPREQGEMVANKQLINPKWEDVFDAYEELLIYTLNGLGKMKIQLSSIFKTEFLDIGGYFLYQKNNSCCEYKRNSLVLTANGNIIPCPAGVNLVFGNIKKENILDIWHQDRTQSFKCLPINRTDCKDCDIWEYCGAGCRIIAQQIHGHFLATDDNACPLYHFFFDRVKPILESHGITPQLLKDSSEYHFNPSLINGL